MASIITHPDQVTPEWLTSALCEAGALRTGRVASVQGFGDAAREWSLSRRLRISYEPGSDGRCPRALFVKVVNMLVDPDDVILPSEVHYYRRDYVGVEGVPLVPCYGARHDDDVGYYYVLLEDLSETHVNHSEEAAIPVDEQQALALVEGLAILHAHLWGNERMASVGYRPHEPDLLNRFVEMARPGVEHIVGTWGDELVSHWPQAMQDIFDGLPALMRARNRDASSLTVIHGDVGPENVFFPRQGARPTFVIDRQPFDWSLTTWLGVYDVAFATVLYWNPEARRRLEETMLRRYHDVLEAHGVTNYSRRKLNDDYRLSILSCVAVATEWCRGRPNASKKHIWMPMLRKALVAVDDLHCRDLLC